MLTRRRHDIPRLEAFSDAVFAFALTLLVVSLDVPTSYADLMRLMAGFVHFAASFALLTWIWYQHNIFFRTYGLQDALTAALNAALLFVVLFYVYPLKVLFTAAFAYFLPGLGSGLVVTPPELARIFAIYGAGFVAIFGMLALLYVRAYQKRDELHLSALDRLDLRHKAGAHLVSAAIGTLSVVVAVAVPSRMAPLAGFVYFLLGPATPCMEF